MNTRLVWVTPEAERLIAYCARVSNPKNQENPEIGNLLRYCIKNGHWSVFEMANMCLEIETSRAISAQIIRHRSFSFQEFSQRYSKVLGFEEVNLRRQDLKNRQNSFDDLDEEVKKRYKQEINSLFEKIEKVYNSFLEAGVAKETARMILPLTTKTRLYMNGTVRSWITYIQLRTRPETQLEHRLIAEGCKKIFIENFPIISEALSWK